MKDLFIETLSQEIKDKLQIQVVNPERDQAFRYNKYLAKVNQFLSLTKFYAGVCPRIQDFISFKISNSDSEDVLESIVGQLCESMALQSLIFYNENSLIDMIINDEITIKLKFSDSLDPVAHQDAVISNLQCQTLLEPDDAHLLLSASTKNDLCIFQTMSHPSFQIQSFLKGKEGYSIFNLFDFTVT